MNLFLKRGLLRGVAAKQRLVELGQKVLLLTDNLGQAALKVGGSGHHHGRTTIAFHGFPRNTMLKEKSRAEDGLICRAESILGSIVYRTSRLARNRGRLRELPSGAGKSVCGG